MIAYYYGCAFAVESQQPQDGLIIGSTGSHVKVLLRQQNFVNVTGIYFQIAVSSDEPFTVPVNRNIRIRSSPPLPDYDDITKQ